MEEDFAVDNTTKLKAYTWCQEYLGGVWKQIDLEEFHIRDLRTQISNILKRKQEWIEEFESHVPLDRKRKFCKTSNDELNAIVYEWFKDSTARMFPVSGPLLQEKAKAVAAELQLQDFKATNGWLEAFRRRHNIIFGKMNGESGGVDTTVVEDWKTKLPELCDGYELRDIFNMDETGLFFKALVDSTLHFKGSDCSGGKRSKSGSR
nr:tigger transposable element-derived protein 4-like [Lytechinus pictus]